MFLTQNFKVVKRLVNPRRNPLTSGQCFLQTLKREYDKGIVTPSQSPHIGSMFLTIGFIDQQGRMFVTVAIPSHRVNVSYQLKEWA